MAKQHTPLLWRIVARLRCEWLILYYNGVVVQINSADLTGRLLIFRFLTCRVSLVSGSPNLALGGSVRGSKKTEALSCISFAMLN
jgi:hypothetical protein